MMCSQPRVCHDENCLTPRARAHLVFFTKPGTTGILLNQREGEGPSNTHTRLGLCRARSFKNARHWSIMLAGSIAALRGVLKERPGAHDRQEGRAPEIRRCLFSQGATSCASTGRGRRPRPPRAQARGQPLGRRRRGCTRGWTNCYATCAREPRPPCRCACSAARRRSRRRYWRRSQPTRVSHTTPAARCPCKKTMKSICACTINVPQFKGHRARAMACYSFAKFQ